MNRDQSAGAAFVAAMLELGYREGKDYLFDDRPWDRQEEVPALVRDLVRLKVDVIVAAAPPSIVGAVAVTQRVPIVMMYAAEPIAMGLVKSLRRPGGNITGLTWDHGFETSVKSLELLKETIPGLRRVGLIWDGTDSVHPTYAKYFEKAAPQVSMTLISAEVRGPEAFDGSFGAAAPGSGGGLVDLPSGQITIPHRRALHGSRGARCDTDGRQYRLGPRLAGRILHYGPHLGNMPRRAAAYVDRILNGANPADLPIEQPDKYDLVVGSNCCPQAEAGDPALRDGARRPRYRVAAEERETRAHRRGAGRAAHRGRLFRKYLLLILALVSGALLVSGAISLYFSYQENKSALAEPAAREGGRARRRASSSTCARSSSSSPTPRCRSSMRATSSCAASSS